MTLLRGLALTGLVVVAVVLQTAVLGQVAVDGVAPDVAVVLQTAVLGQVAVDGVAPDVALVLVIAAALVRGPEFGAGVGFLAGVLVDLAPPADHLVGRWALAFVVVGFLAGRLRHEAGSPVGAVLAVAAGSFIGTSIFALSGLVLHDRVMPVGDMGQVILLGVFLDVIIAALLLPGLLALFRRLSPPQAIL